MKIIKLNGKIRSNTYKLLISDERIPCDIKIVDEKEANHLQINIEDVTKFANTFEDSVENYTKTLFQILLGEIDTSFIDVTANNVTFNKTKNMKFFSKEIQKINYAETMNLLAEHLYQENCQQNDETIKLTQNNNELQEELKRTQEKLDTVIENANKHEERLYSCFIQLLNEKKKYIQFLKFHIDKKDLKDIENSKKNKRKAQISDSETDAEYNTDEESTTNIPRKQSRNTVEINMNTSHTSATTSKSEISYSSNILADSEDESDDAIFCTALPPRVVNANNQNEEVTARIEDQLVEECNGEGDELKTEVKMNICQKSSGDNAVMEQEDKLEVPTPNIVYSTQDLLDDI